MPEETQIDERRVHDEVQKIIGGLLKFDDENRLRIFKTVGTFFAFDSAPASRPIAGSETYSPAGRDARIPSFSGREELPPKEFLYQKQPRTDVERVACLAYYLTHHRDQRHFKTIDLTKLNTEAAQIKFSNAAYAVVNATNVGLLVPAGRGFKQLSAMGERYVDALPDRSAAREVRSSVRARRARRKAAAGNSNSAH